MTYEGEIRNLQRDLAQRTSEYEAKVDEVIRLEKEVAALRYQVQNQTLRADDAVAAYQICLRDYRNLRDGTLTARRGQP
jgi:hypothetical protein